MWWDYVIIAPEDGTMDVLSRWISSGFSGIILSDGHSSSSGVMMRLTWYSVEKNPTQGEISDTMSIAHCILFCMAFGSGLDVFLLKSHHVTIGWGSGLKLEGQVLILL